MNSSSRSGKLLVKSLHVLSACTWTGGCLSWMVVLVSSLGAKEPGRLQVAFDLLFVLCAYLIVPAAFSSLLTGFWICMTTPWGFRRYRWVIVKWIGTVTAILVGAAFLGPWLLQMKEIASMGEPASIQAASALRGGTPLAIIGAAQTIGLVLLCGLSIFKPWGKREIRAEALQPMASFAIRK